ncbi:MAG: WG repeat-containing protein [bacterium]
MRKVRILILLTLFLSANVFFGQQTDPNSLTRAKKNGKWGFLNSSGSFVIAPQFDWVSHFSEGLAAVLVKKRYGFINGSGAFVIPARYKDAGDFSEGLARVKLGGATIYPYGATLTNRKDDKWQFIDKSGNIVFKIKADELGDFSEGLASARIIRSNRYLRCGYLDRQGQWAIAPQFELCERFSGGTAKVILGSQWRWVDKQGKLFAEKPLSQ